jgi:hypothetical protein
MPEDTAGAQQNKSIETSSSWLIRIPEVFADIADEIIARFEPTACTRLGNEYCLIKTENPEGVHASDAAMFVQWNLCVQHSWPCNPQKMDSFIEKAAQTLQRKFGPMNPQAIFIGQLHPTPPNPYYKSLASNLRGRTLQLFPTLEAKEVEDQDGGRDTLFCLVGKEGLFCGMQSPRDCNGLYPGGTKYISQDSSETISRAGAKIAEALHYLLMYRPALPEGSHWVELGASPGGMTSELLARNYMVTAVDRAPLDKRLNRQPGLTFARTDVATFQAKPGIMFDAILSDLNGSGHDSIQHVIRIAKNLKPGGIVVFTLKMPGIETVDETLQLFDAVVSTAAKAGLRLLARTHLTYNRHEFTLFFEKEAAAG